MMKLIKKEEIRIGDCLCYDDEGKYIFCRIKTIVPDYDGHIYCEYFSITHLKCICRRHAIFPMKDLIWMSRCSNALFDRVFDLGRKLHEEIYCMCLNPPVQPLPKRIKVGDCFMEHSEYGYSVAQVHHRDPDCKRKFVVYMSLFSLVLDVMEYDYRWVSCPPVRLRYLDCVDPILVVKLKKLFDMTAMVVSRLFASEVIAPTSEDTDSLGL